MRVQRNTRVFVASAFSVQFLAWGGGSAAVGESGSAPVGGLTPSENVAECMLTAATTVEAHIESSGSSASRGYSFTCHGTQGEVVVEGINGQRTELAYDVALDGSAYEADSLGVSLLGESSSNIASPRVTAEASSGVGCTPTEIKVDKYHRRITACIVYGTVNGKTTYVNEIQVVWTLGLQHKAHFLTVRMSSQNGVPAQPKVSFDVRKDMAIDRTISTLANVGPGSAVASWRSGTQYVYTDGPKGTFWVNAAKMTVYDSKTKLAYKVAGHDSSDRFNCYKTKDTLCKFK